MRRIFVLGLASALVLVALGTFLYFWFEGSKKVTSEALRAIPTDAGIVIKSNGFAELSQKILDENQLWAALSGFDLISDADRIARFTDSLRRTSPLPERLIYTNPVFLSVHPVGKGNPAILLTANLPAGVNANDIVDFAQNISKGTHKLTEKEYNGIAIYTFVQSISQKTNEFSIAVQQGVVMASTSLLLVESAIGQLGSSVSLAEDKSFAAIQKTAGTRVDANVFINHAKFSSLFDQLVNTKYRTGFNALSDLAGWSELDLILKPDAVFLNGFSQASDSLNHYYNIFANQKPVPIKVTDVLPAQTSAFVFLGISDVNTYFQNYKKYLESKSELRTYQNRIGSMNQSLGVDIVKTYSSFFGCEISLAFIPFDGQTNESSWFTIVGTTGKSKAQDELTLMIESFANRNKKSVKEFERTFNIDKEKSVKIYRMPVKGMHHALFGSLFAEVNDEFFTFIDSYIIFGSSVESLSRLILANIHNKQLSADQSFRQFSENLSPESNFTAFVIPGKSEALLRQLLEKNQAINLTSQMEILRKIQGVTFQLNGGRGMVFNNICVKYSPVSIDDPQTVWETRLDTTITMKPQLVINHNTQNREIFVQDYNNNIYLINDIGRVLWKKPIAEPIMGEAVQVDIFRNGKLQLLFNTKSYLYLIDRNGNNVEGFPVKLRSRASNPVAVFDYEGNRDYRFFIAGEDRRIYAYDKNGNILPGWEFERSEKIVTKPLQHFRVSNRDYIVFADENRTYILDRRGNERVKPAQFFAQAPNSTFVLEHSSSKTPPRLVTSDTLGFVRFIYFDGRVDDKAFRTLSSNHAFDYQDVDADGLKDFIFIDNNNLYVYKNNGSELFSKKFNHKLMPKSIYFHFGGRDRKIGVVCEDQPEIYLINNNGELYKGFPLKGITPFSIGQFASTKTKFNLVVGSSSGFVLNYAVH